MIKPLISIILPLSDETKEEEIFYCLQSLKKQQFKNFELILVTNLDFSPALEKLIKTFPSLIIKGNFSKTKARNIGAEKAKGAYLLHIDHDMTLVPSLLKECYQKITKTRPSALIIPEFLSRSSTLLACCRELEKKIFLGDFSAESPRLIKKEIFEKIGGFDETLDPLDEWGLYLALLKQKVKISRLENNIFIFKSENLSKLLLKKYKAGRMVNHLLLKYPYAPQVNLSIRIRSFFRNFSFFLSSPFTFFSLCFLKSIELFAFLFGTLRPPFTKKEAEIFFDQESLSYEEKFYQKTKGARFVDKTEKESIKGLIKKFLKKEKVKILDLGVGTGRLSEFILKVLPKSQVIGFDISQKMAQKAFLRLKKYKNQFIVKTGSMTNLPFKNDCFDLVISFRSLKYLPDITIGLKEIKRVLKKGGYLILELPQINLISAPLFILTPFLNKIFSHKLFKYFIQIPLFSKKSFQNLLKQIGLKEIQIQSIFTLPSTLYSKINSSFGLSFSQSFEKILPKSLFGRSLLALIQKPINSHKEKILVSVIIPTKNSEETLPILLKSLKNQTYPLFEIIVVDNNSTDKTKEIAKKYTQKVYNFGPERSAQRNFGAEKAKGDYLLFIDSDMELDKEVIHQCIQKIKNDQDIKALIIPEISKGKGYWALTRALEKDCYLGDETIEAARFVKKDLFQKESYDERLTAFEDWDLNERIKRRYPISRIFGRIIHHEGKLSLISLLLKKYYYAQNFPFYFKKYPKRALKQMNLILRMAFLRNWLKLLKHPFLALGLFTMKSCETIIGGLGFIKGFFQKKK